MSWVTQYLSQVKFTFSGYLRTIFRYSTFDYKGNNKNSLLQKF